MKMFLLVLLGVLAFSAVGTAQVWVDPSVRPDGTQGQGDRRGHPNDTARGDSNVPGSYGTNTGRMTPGEVYRIGPNVYRIPDDDFQTAPRRNPFGNPFENPFRNPFPH